MSLCGSTTRDRITIHPTFDVQPDLSAEAGSVAERVGVGQAGRARMQVWYLAGFTSKETTLWHN